MATPAAFFSALATRLTDPAVPSDDVLKALVELRDRLDVVHTPEYPRFLDAALESLLKLLGRFPPQFVEGTGHRYGAPLPHQLCRVAFSAPWMRRHRLPYVHRRFCRDIFIKWNPFAAV